MFSVIVKLSLSFFGYYSYYYHVLINVVCNPHNYSDKIILNVKKKNTHIIYIIMLHTIINNYL